MKHLGARDCATIYCNRCCQRFAIIFEPDFARGEEDQCKPQMPCVCPFCGADDADALEQEGEVQKDVKAYNVGVIRNMVRS